MHDSLAGVVLAAGIGQRLRPLSLARPKALCPVGGVPLVDLALDRVAPFCSEVAVNVHAGRVAMLDHLGCRVHISLEAECPLGTAGALGNLRGWLDGRDALVVNADAWCPGSPESLVQGWDRRCIRLLLVGEDELRPSSRVAAALMPWGELAGLSAQPSGLYEVSWLPAAVDGRLEALCHDGPFVDCGTPADYLAANLAAGGGASVIGEGAVVLGTVERCVVWDGAVVGPREHLVDAIRTDTGITVLVR
jgi:NDP-sugar pyrophosphorylase family protein